MTGAHRSVDNLSYSIKSAKLEDQIREQNSYFAASKMHLLPPNKHHLRVKGWIKNIPSKWSKEKPGVVILISDKIDWGQFSSEEIISLHTDQENCSSKENIILNMCVPNAGSGHFIKQVLLDLKSQSNSNSAVGDFTVLMSPLDTPVEQISMTKHWD